MKRSARDRLLDAADRLFYNEGVHNVGVTSGASVPESLVDGVLDRLAESGYADVEIASAAEESLVFSLPQELRRDLKAADQA